jgi:hypothetical protein
VVVVVVAITTLTMFLLLRTAVLALSFLDTQLQAQLQ